MSSSQSNQLPAVKTISIGDCGKIWSMDYFLFCGEINFYLNFNSVVRKEIFTSNSNKFSTNLSIEIGDL